MNDMTEQILDDLRPRMQAARVAHVRRVVGALALVPLVGIGAYAVAAENGPTSPTIETATDEIDPPVVDEPDPTPTIDEAATDEEAEGRGSEADGDGEGDEAPPTTKAPTTTTLAPDAPRLIEAGVLGLVEVKPTDTGFDVVEFDLVQGWEVLGQAEEDGVLRILVGDGETMKAIVIKPGIRGEILVSVETVAFPTTTTTVKPEPAPEPKPTPEPTPEPVVDRIVVEVPGKGSFVVERDGDVLYAGAVTANEGYEAEVIKAEGWKVYVGFYGEDHVWFGKALINDNGDIEQVFWDEPLGPTPIYQWVEVPGVGAAKFEILEGQVRVHKTETAEGFGAWDYNEGAFGETAKVDFEGEGQIWFIDAWVTESGELGWTSYQGGE